MLKGINPLVSPELLHVLASMGHGDDIALVDSNFPATSMGRRVLRMDGADLLQATEAVLSLLPLDTFVNEPIATMAVVDSPEEIPDVQRGLFALADAMEGRPIGVERLERFAFYARVRECFGVVITGESRAYGNVVLTKGVIFGQ